LGLPAEVSALTADDFGWVTEGFISPTKCFGWATEEIFLLFARSAVTAEDFGWTAGGFCWTAERVFSPTKRFG
jgi:hypothetical protein